MPTPSSISLRLRNIRKAQGLTLRQVEIRSRGAWKSVVLGSYERGNRTLSVEKALLLCDFYGVPSTALFSEATPLSPRQQSKPVDLLALRRFPSERDAIGRTLQRFIEQIIQVRHDWNGQVLSLRQSDWQTMAMLQGLDEGSLKVALENRSLFFGSGVIEPDRP